MPRSVDHLVAVRASRWYRNADRYEFYGWWDDLYDLANYARVAITTK
ncbi:hypothetical protein [Nocardia farcinica]|uniref:Uncharacterized protein n=1 Tax=Nocardia farcinica (strain IFM 10152) TaxID=247156 RepID=Q5YSI8_NOCFA|nr:hypothetical protein [Nocardia farcinica]BAD58853.1 hypothetical protein NFA_40050 [Nocardia farcinica IFM 10152]